MPGQRKIDGAIPRGEWQQHIQQKLGVSTSQFTDVVDKQ